MSELKAPVDAPLKLTPPEVIEPVLPVQTVGAVPLPDAAKAKVEAQLESFIAALKTENVQSDAFRAKLDSAFQVGRVEIADVTKLTNAFTEGNFVNEVNSPAYKAISEMRQLFDELNPANQGDLFAPNKVWGIIPFGTKLQSYLRRYEGARNQIEALYEVIVHAQDDVRRSVTELGDVRKKLWGGLEKLEAVVYFISELDNRLSAEIDAMKLADPVRARALEQEVLYYVRQNLGDVQGTQALTINAYNIADELRKCGREVIIGCQRMETMGMSALSIAVTLARATGVQIRTLDVLEKSKQSVEALISATGDAMLNHTKRVAAFSANPLLGVQKLQEMFDKTAQAVDVMDTYRSDSLVTMKANNEMLRGMVTTHIARIESSLTASGAADAIAL
jgi:uncharacterized protein YaaN involved in tellurite resistance